MSRPQTLVTVAVFRDPWDAYIARGRLHAEGLVTILADENIIWMDWAYSQAVGGVKLWVPAHTVEQAMRVLRGLEGGDYAELLEDYEPVFDAAPCSHCDIADPEPVFSMQDLLLVIGLVLFLGLIFPARRCQYRCRHCGHVWDRDLKA